MKSVIDFNLMQQGLPTEKHYNVTHFQQRFNWDCGISCILMILTSTQRQEFLDNFNKICEDEGFGASTWTIDLCYILKKFEVRHEYFTKTLGVDPNYSQHSYYTKIIDKDEKRIEKKFNEAKTHGLYVEQRTVEMLELLGHMAKHGPVILLTNASLLTCEVCKQNVLDKVRRVTVPKSNFIDQKKRNLQSTFIDFLTQDEKERAFAIIISI